ncbi:MAG: hypothetical protein MHMPM18_000667 [Marteilia pararefringens]
METKLLEIHSRNYFLRSFTTQMSLSPIILACQSAAALIGNSSSRCAKCTVSAANLKRMYSIAGPTARREYVRNKLHCNVGTIGHVDHGKTTLTAAITKHLSERKLARYVSYENIDKAPDERKRGITINASVVEYTSKHRHYAHTDCPGHLDYIKNMIVGTATMDYGILVVAATDGVMPQTREHLILARQTDINNLAVFINKCDTADEEMISLVEMEIQELLAQYQFEEAKCPIVFGSALCSLNGTQPEIGEKSIEKLIEALDNFPDPTRNEDSPFILPIDNVHSIKNKGTVVTGKLMQGTLTKGQEAVIQGYNTEMKTSLVSIETFLKSVDEGKAGDILGVCVKNIKRDKLKRGMVLSKPKTLECVNNIRAKIYALSKEESGSESILYHEGQCQMFQNTFKVSAFVYMDDGPDSFLMPGDSAEMRILMNKKMPLQIGSRFTIRKGPKTLGYGIVTKFEENEDWFEVEEERKKRKKAIEKAKKLAEEQQAAA